MDINLSEDSRWTFHFNSIRNLKPVQLLGYLVDLAGVAVVDVGGQPLPIGGLGGQTVQHDAARARVVRVGDLVFIPDVDLLYGHL